MRLESEKEEMSQRFNFSQAKLVEANDANLNLSSLNSDLEWEVLRLGEKYQSLEFNWIELRQHTDTLEDKLYVEKKGVGIGTNDQKDEEFLLSDVKFTTNYRWESEMIWEVEGTFL
jgi:predicted nuclease with TOPRIM domain